MTATKIRVKELRMVDPASLLDHPKNWRRHPPTQQAAMQKALDAVGLVDAILVRETGEGLQIIDGHLRHELVQGGTIPVLVTDLSEEEGERVLATFDPIATLAEQDSEQLAELFKSLGASEDDLITAVWPDYVIDPLLSAEWRPNKEDSISRHSRTTMIAVSDEQYGVIKPALDKVRGDDQTVSDGRCLELICADFLAG